MWPKVRGIASHRARDHTGSRLCKGVFSSSLLFWVAQRERSIHPESQSQFFLKKDTQQTLVLLLNSEQSISTEAFC